MEYQKLHLGCGLNTPPDWLNVDGSWNARLAKYPLLRRMVRSIGIIPREQLDIPWDAHIFTHDVRLPLPFENGAFQCVYASHLLEHLYLAEGKRLLTECFRVIKPGGVLRMVVPDLKSLIEEYGAAGSSNDGLKDRACRFNEKLLMHGSQPASGNIFRRLYASLNDFHTHKWMYDAAALIECFQGAGFAEVLEMACNESRIQGIEGIEDPGRVLHGAGICVEGIRLEASQY
jgi:SAM-dependent methyltransferase